MRAPDAKAPALAKENGGAPTVVDADTKMETEADESKPTEATASTSMDLDEDKPKHETDRKSVV